MRDRPTAVLPFLLLLGGGVIPAARVCAGDGQLDVSFGGDGSAYHNVALDAGSRDTATAVAVQRDGRVVVAGFASDDDGEGFKVVVDRLLASGQLDSSFATGGTFILDFSSNGLPYTEARAVGVALDGDERILVVGWAQDAGIEHPLILRLTPAGALDPAFFGDGILLAAAVGGGSDIAVDRATGVVWAIGTTNAGSVWTWRWSGGTPVERYWVVSGAENQTGDRLIVQPDGRPVLAGTYIATGTVDVDLYAARLLASGTAADPTFGSSGLAAHGFDVDPPDYDDDLLLDLALDPRGRIVLFAETEVAESTFGTTDLGFVRLTPAGTPDPTFGGSGAVRIPFLTRPGQDAWYSGGVAVEGNGRIVAGSTVGSTPFGIVAGALRLLESGALDLGFGGAGTGKIVVELDPEGGPGDERCGFRAVALEAGRMVGVGPSEWLDPDFDLGFARLENALIFADGFEIGSGFFWSSLAL